MLELTHKATVADAVDCTSYGRGLVAQCRRLSILVLLMSILFFLLVGSVYSTVRFWHLQRTEVNNLQYVPSLVGDWFFKKP